MMSISFSESQNGAFLLNRVSLHHQFSCISALNLTGQQIGGAFEFRDDTAKAHILVLPGTSHFVFSYRFDDNAPSCTGDFGQGATDNSPWDYVQPAL